MFEKLLELGLSKEEAIVYISCLELGGSPVSKIAKISNINRVNCYYILEKLIKKKLIIEFKQNKTRSFIAESPEKFKQIALDKLKLAENIIPEMMLLVNSFGHKPKVKVYEGLSGVIEIFEKSLKSKTEIIGFTNLIKITDIIPDYFSNYTKKKIHHNIKTRYIVPNTINIKNLTDKFLPKKYDKNLIEIIFVDNKEFLFENEIFIFGDCVGIVSLNKKEIFGFVVESSNFSSTMKTIFDLAWLGSTSFMY